MFVVFHFPVPAVQRQHVGAGCGPAVEPGDEAYGHVSRFIAVLLDLPVARHRRDLGDAGEIDQALERGQDIDAVLFDPPALLFVVPHMLAHEFCGRENRHNRVGKLCLASARKLLPALTEILVVRLPEAEALEFDPHAHPPSDFPDSSVSSPLRDLGALVLELVTAPVERRRREAAIDTWHPEGWRHPPGRQAWYWVRLERDGALGGIGFTATGIRPGLRNGVIGWSVCRPLKRAATVLRMGAQVLVLIFRLVEESDDTEGHPPPGNRASIPQGGSWKTRQMYAKEPFRSGSNAHLANCTVCAMSHQP